jgi:hypothetical protein
LYLTDYSRPAKEEKPSQMYCCAERLERGWPLLTVGTGNGDSKSTNGRGPSLVGSLGFSCRYKRFLFCLGCSNRPRRKKFFFTVFYFNSFIPTSQQAGQAAMLVRLSLSMCLWYSASTFLPQFQIAVRVLSPCLGPTIF